MSPNIKPINQSDLKSLTNDGVFFSVLQLRYGHKVTVHCGNSLAVVTQHNEGVAVKGHLIVVLQFVVLFVGELQCSIGDFVHLQETK